MELSRQRSSPSSKRRRTGSPDELCQLIVVGARSILSPMAAGSRLEEVLRPARALPPDRAWRARAVTVDDAQAAPTRANGRLFAAVLSLMLTARPWGLARFLQPGYVVTLGARHRLQRERHFLVRVGSCAERQRHPGEEEDEDRRGHRDR